MTGRRRTMWSVMLGGACAMVLAAMSAPGVMSAPPAPTGERPECPHTWPDTITLKIEERGNVSSIAAGEVPGPTFPSRNIPEFNDCQRIILPANQVTDSTSYGGPPARYGPLMALFADERLGKLDSLVAATDSVFAAVQVFNYAPGFRYHPLEIFPLYNCLYLWGEPTQRKARMVARGVEPHCPPRPVAVLDTSHPRLRVVEAARGVFTSPNDYPVTARWEWDPTTNTQYISVRCGDRTCFVGRPRQGTIPQFRPDDSYIPVPTTGTPSANDRVRYIPGWYDRQRLAMETRAGLVPSGVVGWVFPSPELGSRHWPAYRDTFLVVGHIALEADGVDAPGVSYYKRKFNYDVVRRGTPLRMMTELSLCLGTDASCGVPDGERIALAASCRQVHQETRDLTGPASAGGVVQQSNTTLLDPSARWFARVRSPATRRTMFRCVTRRVDPHVTTIGIPATTRWRWLATDETTWDFCGSGCCEMSAK
jgi:hypothetical protein